MSTGFDFAPPCPNLFMKPRYDFSAARVLAMFENVFLPHTDAAVLRVWYVL